MELAFESVGRGSPVVLLHGLFASGRCWREVAAELARHHRVLSVDLRNHGASPGSESMACDAMARDVLALLARECPRAATVLGHCIGGKVAMAMALLEPAAIHRLVVVDAAPVTFLDPWSHQLRSLRRGLSVRGNPQALLKDPPAGGDAWLNRFALPRTAVVNAYLDWRCNLAGIEPALPALRDFPEALKDRRCALTLHAVLGADSAFVRPADARAFLPMFGSVDVRLLEGASHWVHASRPEALLHALRSAMHPAPGSITA